MRVGTHIGRNHLFAQAHHLVALGVQLERLRGVVVGNHQVATALHQPHHGVVHVERNQSALERAKVLAQAGHPGGKEREGQRVGHGKLDKVVANGGVRAQHGARALQRLQHVLRLVAQRLARSGQARRVAAAVHQIGAGPGLERLDAPRKRRLRHMAQLRRATETMGLGQRNKIFKPFGFHGRDYQPACLVPGKDEGRI